MPETFDRIQPYVNTVATGKVEDLVLTPVYARQLVAYVLFFLAQKYTPSTNVVITMVEAHYTLDAPIFLLFLSDKIKPATIVDSPILFQFAKNMFKECDKSDLLTFLTTFGTHYKDDQIKETIDYLVQFLPALYEYELHKDNKP